MYKLKLKNKIKYNTIDVSIDDEVKKLCDALNCLPGIETFESCCGHGNKSFNIYFKVIDNKGLFFLTRCIDKRYWKYGGLWDIKLSIGDDYENDYRPIIYTLTSNDVLGHNAYKQAINLIDNMNYHLNHKQFLKMYDLKKSDFQYKKIKKNL